MSSSANPVQARDAQRAFDRAITIYRERMTTKEFGRLKEVSSLSHLVEQSQAICEGLRPGSTSTLKSKASKLAISLAPFERILEGFCKLSPMGGDLIWGSVSFILEQRVGRGVGVLYGHDRRDQISAGGREHNESDIVSPAVEAIYAAIIEFWVKAVEYYRNKMKKDIISRSKSWLASSSKMVNEFAKLKEKIRVQKTKLHEVATAQYHADDKLDRMRSRQERFSDWIGAPSYEHDLRAANECRHDGTCEWLKGKHEYVDWMEGRTSGLLVIYGTAGVGKTILTSWLVHNTPSQPTGHVTIYHFFKEIDDSKNTALAAARSLLEQFYDVLLLNNHPLVTTLEADLQRASRKKHADFEILWEIFSSLLSRYCQSSQPGSLCVATIALDAMDECQDAKKLVQSLRKLVKVTSTAIRVVVTARTSGDHVDAFRRFHVDQTLPVVLELTVDDLQDDIATFVTYYISQIERLGGTKHHDLRERVIAVFSDVRNHQGMFLWAYLMCKEVECQLRVSDIWQLLEHLPKSLYGTYAQICKRLSANNERNREFSRRVLQWIVASRRPMTFLELEEALRLSTAGSGDSFESQFFDKDGGLLWSRSDIVVSCGDLVRYTGLAEDDTIGIVHLSARQFLSAHVSELFQWIPNDLRTHVESFLVDVRSAELEMGTTCIKYILATSVHSEDYLSPIQLSLVRAPRQDRFKSRYPLFNYATIYWTDYTFSVIESQPYVDGADQQLLTTITTFFRSSMATVWLEELMRLTYLEFAQHTLRRFTSLNEALPKDISLWLYISTKALLDFSPDLSLRPQLIRLCISQLHLATPGDYETVNSDILTLEADLTRRWVHYDVITGNMFSIAGLNQHFIRCQSLNTGVRLRPIQLQLPIIPHGGLFVFQSGIVSTLARRIAITFQHRIHSYSGYFITCWAIQNLASDLDNWAVLIFSSYAEDQRNMFSRRGVVAFGREDTIITPDGIFNLTTKERVQRPSNIFDPGPTSHVTDTYFSGHGEHVARISNNTLEVLDIHGVLLATNEFPGSSNVYLQHLSDTGAMVVVFLEGETPGLSCFAVKEAKQITLPLPSGQWSLHHLVFTQDEAKLLASMLNMRNPPNYQLAVWTFTRNEDGSYRGSTDMIFIFETVGLCFDLVEPSAGMGIVESTFIVDTDGTITKRPLDLKWLPPKEESLWSSWIVTRNSFLPELVIWSLHDDILTVEKWSLKAAQPELINVSDTAIPPLALPLQLSTISPDGNYLATDTFIIDGSGTSKRFGICELQLHGKMEGAAFSMDGTLFASIHEKNEISTLNVFDLSPGPSISHRAFFIFNGTLDHKLSFNESDPSLLAVDNYILKLKGHELIVHAEIDRNVGSFSACGLFYFTLGFELYRLVDDPDHAVSISNQMRHPQLIELNVPYVYSPHALKLQRSGGVFFLKHKLIPDDNNTCRARVICVISDGMHGILDDFALLWPEKDTENLKLMVVHKEKPKFFGVGITKGELMMKEEWFDGLRFDD